MAPAKVQLNAQVTYVKRSTDGTRSRPLSSFNPTPFPPLNNRLMASKRLVPSTSQ